MEKWRDDRPWPRRLLSWGARNKMLLLMVGGAIGTYARFVVGSWFKAHPWGQAFPFGTLVINVTGSFILAAATVIIFKRLPPEEENLALLICTGFCGGYTTFSTFELETFNLVERGSYGYAAANVVGSVVAGFVGVVLGVKLVEFLIPRG